jgi:hypothetical protein
MLKIIIYRVYTRCIQLFYFKRGFMTDYILYLPLEDNHAILSIDEDNRFVLAYYSDDGEMSLRCASSFTFIGANVVYGNMIVIGEL